MLNYALAAPRWTAAALLGDLGVGTLQELTGRCQGRAAQDSVLGQL